MTELSSLSGTAPAAWQVYTDIQGLEQLKQQARQDEKGALKAVARQFEALFLEMVLKEARKTRFDTEGLLSSERTRFFQDWQDRQLAQDLAERGGIGLAEQLVRQLTPKQPVLSVAEYEQWRQDHPDTPLTTQAILQQRALAQSGERTAEREKSHKE